MSWIIGSSTVCTRFIFLTKNLPLVTTVSHGRVPLRSTLAKIRWAIENKEIAQRLAELEHYFFQHCKDKQSDIRELREAMDLLIDRTKPAKIGFKTD